MDMCQQRKTQQLCHQVAETLNLVLSGECSDEILQGLYVQEVQPSPDSSQLLVIVSGLVPGEPLDPVDVLTRLHRHSGQLRAEVAAAITRRKTPRLLFRVAEGPHPMFLA